MFKGMFSIQFVRLLEYFWRSVDQAGTLSLRGPAQFTQRGAERRVSGWDGVLFPGGMGWGGVGRVIKSLLQLSLYLQSVKKMKGPKTSSVKPIHPPHQTRRSAPRCVNCAGPRREGVPAWSTLFQKYSSNRTNFIPGIPLKLKKNQSTSFLHKESL